MTKHKKTEIVKEKKCRHKWKTVYIDCPLCGGGEYKECEKCGEESVND